MSEATAKAKPGWKSLVALIVLTLGAGGLVGFFIRNDMDFYDTLSLPAFAPPGWVFPIAWSLLYTAMAVSIWFVLRTGDPSRVRLTVLYAVQLAVNLIWPVLFFTQHALGLAFVWLVLLWALVLILMLGSFRLSQTAGWLLLPYLLWISFAGLLNFFVARMNP